MLNQTLIDEINSPVQGGNGQNAEFVAAPNSPGGATDGITVTDPITGDSFFDPAATLNLTPSAGGGTGGQGKDGDSSSGNQGGGEGAAGGPVTLTVSNDTIGSAASPYGGSASLSATAGAEGGGDGGWGAAGEGPVAGNGADGGRGGIAQAVITDLSAVTTSVLSIAAKATGGSEQSGDKGLGFGNGGQGGSNGVSTDIGGVIKVYPDFGGNGGAGGAGGDALAELSDSTLSSTFRLLVDLVAGGGQGGDGGMGGRGGATTTTTATSSYSVAKGNGNGGAGGPGGNATATLTGNVFTSPDLTIALSTEFTSGGTGGPGGSNGPSEQYTQNGISYTYIAQPPGLNGSAGADGSADIDLSNNTGSVANGSLRLALDDEGPTEQIALNGARGGNLTFAGNSFLGAGSATLFLNIGGGGATVNTASDTIGIGGSPGNAMTGFDTFFLDDNDTFVAGPLAYTVSFGGDPDTLVYTPQSGDVTVKNATVSNMLLDFSGFGSTLDATSLQNDTTTVGNNTFITIPNAGKIELVGFAGAIQAGDISFATQCYRAGTRIATPRGDIPIDDLAVGATVHAHFAGVAEVTWVGRRRVDCRRHPTPRKVWPVRVHAGAFGRGIPRRDLWLSPDHAVFVEDVLIPIKRLMNGITIEQVPMDEVTYYHIALPVHDVVLAEGLPAESYLDTGNRSNFANGGGPIALHPDLSACLWEAMGCARLIMIGPELDAARRCVKASAAALERQHAIAQAVA